MAEKKLPPVRVRARGQISRALESYAEKYREQYPDRDVRYVYDPAHKPELSGILGRQAEGYEIVTYSEVGDEKEDRADKPVRVGDLVLMSIGREEREKLKLQREIAAAEQRVTVQRSYYEEIEKAATAAKPAHHSRNPSKPVGIATIEEKEFSYNIEQRSEEGGK